MKFHFSLRWLVPILFAMLFLLPPAASAAEVKKDAQTIMNEMRLKKWSKDLELTAEQQKKVLALIEEEGRQITKLDDNGTELNVRRTKINELRQATYAKIKPILSVVQLETFEKLLVKMQPKKK